MVSVHPAACLARTTQQTPRTPAGGILSGPPAPPQHHFVHPRWFEALGGFEAEANISHFVTYAQTAFRRGRGVLALLTCARLASLRAGGCCCRCGLLSWERLLTPLPPCWDHSPGTAAAAAGRAS